MAAQTLGPKAFCLVDLGHHAPNVNIEMIVARLVHAQRLGGFHFNDSKYGDDDLDAGSIEPFRLFLVFNELVEAELAKAPNFHPAHMLDQSHNVTDPIESLMTSAIELQRAYAQALIVDRTGAARIPHRQRRADGGADAEARLHHRRVADPRAGARAQGRGHRSGRRVSQERLSRQMRTKCGRANRASVVA